MRRCGRWMTTPKTDESIVPLPWQTLHGSDLGHLWKYRVGNWRIIARIEEEVATVPVVRIGKRREVYQR